MVVPKHLTINKIKKKAQLRPIQLLNKRKTQGCGDFPQ